MAPTDRVWLRDSATNGVHDPAGEVVLMDWKFIALGHNTVRGAAGAAVLNAELMVSEGMLD